MPEDYYDGPLSYLGQQPSVMDDLAALAARNKVPGLRKYLEGSAISEQQQPVVAEPYVAGLDALEAPATSPAVDPVLAAYLKKIGVDAAMAATLSADDMKRMAYAAREDAYNTAMQADLRRSGNLQRIGTTYAEAHPEDYYNTFGTIPINSLGKSRFGVTEAGGLDTKEGAEGIKYLTPDETATYTLYSPRSGQTLGTGTGAQGLLSLTQMAQSQTANKDRKADWQLIKTPAGGGTPEVISSNLFNSDLTTLGKIVATGLPIAASFIPGLNFLGSTLGAMVNAGAAGALGAAMKDENILKAGIINAATAGLMNAPVLPGGGSLAKSIGTAINKVPVLGDVTQALGKIGSGAASKAVGDEIVVTGARNVAPRLVSGGVSSLANAFTPSVATNPVTGDMSLVRPTQPSAQQPAGGLTMADPNAIVVTGTPRAAANVATNIAQGGVQGALNTLTQGPTEPRRQDYGDKVEPDTTEDDPLVVRGIRYGDITAANAARAAAAAGAASLAQGPRDNVARPEDEIVVTRRNDPAVTGNLVASTIANFAPSLNAPTTPTTPTTTDAKKSDTLDKISGALELAGLVTPFLGGGSGSGSSSATMPRGLGSANPLYSAKLPTPGVNGAFQVGGMGANSGALPVPAGGDYTRFGMGNAPTRVAPADIPQYGGVNPPGFDTQTWEWLGPQTSAPAVDFAVLPNPGDEPVKKAMGGYAVGGPGDGRSDEIPAMLSDGEYVMDAETVALLGNGSNKAGAKALDKFRANIRKQKGRKLAQGKFSVNAKRPEAYLSGGR